MARRCAPKVAWSARFFERSPSKWQARIPRVRIGDQQSSIRTSIMKTFYNVSSKLIMVAIACSFVASAPIQARPADDARLIVNRSADFGVDESINLAVERRPGCGSRDQSELRSGIAGRKACGVDNHKSKDLWTASFESNSGERGAGQDLHLYCGLGRLRARFVGRAIR